jgi:hypothetical protein
MDRFAESIAVDRTTGCWLWTHVPNNRGYPNFWLTATRQTAAAYRWIYTQLERDIPPDYHLHHVCEVQRCVNPDHLELWPVSGPHNHRKRHLKTHCVNGHALTPENLYRQPNGQRVCRLCRRERKRAHR